MKGVGGCRALVGLLGWARAVVGALKTFNSFNSLNTLNTSHSLKTFNSLNSISLNPDAIYLVPSNSLVIEGISSWPIEEACY